MGGHDHDYARLRLLGLLAERNIPALVANDFVDVEKWLPVTRLLITYVAGPYPDATQSRAIQQWLERVGVQADRGLLAVGRFAERDQWQDVAQLERVGILGG